MTTPDIPLLDIEQWREGTPEQRSQVAARMDEALGQSGFLLISNHGISPSLRDTIRAQARSFFALPAERKQPYATRVAGRGWIPPGGEANAFYGEVADPERADLKESLTIGREFATGDPETDEKWFTPNVWPVECPGLRDRCEVFTGQVRELYYDLLRMCATALDLDDEDFFVSHVRNERAADLQHQPVPAADGHRGAQGRAVPGRPAHRLGHPDDLGPPARLRRPAGAEPRRHLG